MVDWMAQCQTAGVLLSIEVDARVAASRVEAFVDALRCWRLSAGWGGPVSQITPLGLLPPGSAEVPVAPRISVRPSSPRCR